MSLKRLGLTHAPDQALSGPFLSLSEACGFSLSLASPQGGIGRKLRASLKPWRSSIY